MAPQLGMTSIADLGAKSRGVGAVVAGFDRPDRWLARYEPRIAGVALVDDYIPPSVANIHSVVVPNPGWRDSESASFRLHKIKEEGLEGDASLALQI